MVNKRLKILLRAVIIFNLACLSAYAQEISGIQSLRSDCNDVKRILKVEQCKFPQSIYNFAESTVIVNFVRAEPAKDDRICWNALPGTVLSVSVILNKLIPLEQLSYQLEPDKEREPSDTGSVIYRTKDKSVAVEVTSGFAGVISYLPSERDYQNLSYACSSPDKGDDVRLPVQWFDRYWNLPPAKEKKRLENVILAFQKLEDTSPRKIEIYFVYYYNSENDKESGIKQANRAKKHLELQGIKSTEIRTVNGGKSEKPKIVVYLLNHRELQ